MSLLTNISDTNLIEGKKIAELEQRMALLMINTEENFVLIDTNMNIVIFNNQFKKQYQLFFGKEVKKGESILSYAQPERIEIVKAIYQKVFSGETLESEIHLPLPDKTVATFLNRFKPALDEDEKIIGAFVSSKDITEKIRSQEQLVASEKRFRALIENAADIIALIDQDLKVSYVSPALKKITGFNSEEIIGAPCSAIINMGQEDDYEKIIAELLKNPGVPMPRLNSFRHKNGDELWLEGTVTNLLSDKNVGAIVANYRDITERKIAEEKNSQSEANLRAIFDNSSEGLMLLDTNGVIKAFNSKSAENHMLYNVKNDLQVGNQLIDYVDESRKEYFSQLLTKVLHGESIQYDIDYQRKDGGKNWFHASLTPVLESGIVSGICIARSDISERKNAEEKLKQGHEILTRLTENVPAAIYKFEIDSEGRMSFPFMSKSIEYLVPGVTVNEIIADASVAFSYVHPDDLDKLLQSIEESRINIENWDLEYRILNRDNTIRWFQGSSRLKKDTGRRKDDKIEWYGYLEDITERKNAEIRLQNLLSISGDQNNRLQNFSFIVSHNIRSHSSNIIGLVDMIRKVNNDGDKSKFFDMLKTSTDKLGETIENLNDIITIQNDLNIKKTRLNLKEEINKTTNAINSLISQTNTTINNNVYEDTFIEVIPSYLESVLLNILTNAIKYKSSERDPVITIADNETENYLILSIADNGLGIDLKRNGEKLFGMYKTFHNNTDARGFGLFISKNQMEAMNGKIEVESELGIGSKFKIYIRNAED